MKKGNDSKQGRSSNDRMRLAIVVGWYRSYHPLLLTYASRLLRSRSNYIPMDATEPEDLVQETFQRVWIFSLTRLKTYPASEEKTRSLLKGVLFNVFRDRQRGERRRIQRHSYFLDLSGLDKSDFLENCLEMLTDDNSKKAFQLFYKEGYTIDEIGKELNIPGSKVKKLMKAIKSKVVAASTKVNP